MAANPTSSKIDAQGVRVQVDRIVQDRLFSRSPDLSRFLRFVVEETLAGRSAEIKEYSIATGALERRDEFDPKDSNIVRVQARNLRRKLTEYYEGTGASDPILIELPTGTYAPVIRVNGLPRRRRTRLWIIAPALAVIAVALVFSRTGRVQERLPVHQVTIHASWTGHPAVSSDGQTLVFASDRGQNGSTDIWVQPWGGTPVQLTDTPGPETTPDISPDGSLIVYRSYKDGGGVNVIPRAGGTERRLADGGWAPRFSPDGAWVAFISNRRTGSSEMYLIRAGGGPAYRIHTEVVNTAAPIWTPAGDGLLFLGGEDDKTYEWWVAELDLSGEPRVKRLIQTGLAAAMLSRESKRLTQDSFPADWVGRDALLYRSGEIHLVPLSSGTWKVAGSIRQLLPGRLLDAPRAVRGPGGRHRIVFGVGSDWVHVWSVPLEPSTGLQRAPMVQLTNRPGMLAFGERHWQRLSRDGRKLIYMDLEDHKTRLWFRDLVSGSETRLPGSDYPLINRNGTRVLTLRGQQGLLLSEGESTRKVTDGCKTPLDWSHNEQWILCSGADGLERVESKTGNKQCLIPRSSAVVSQAAFSPDGRWIAVVFSRPGMPLLRGIVARHGPSGLAPEADWIHVTDEENHLGLEWSNDSGLLYYLHTRDGHRCLWAQRFDPARGRLAGEAFPMRHFHSRFNKYPNLGSWISVAQDKIAIKLAETTSNVYATEWFR